MKKTLLSLVLILAVLRILSAAPAYRGPVTRTQPDGSTIVTYIHGDEFGHWVSDAQGNELVQGEDGWWKPAATEAAPAIQQRAALRRAAANARRRSAPRRASNFGSPRIPVILVGFKDKAFSKSADDFDALLNLEGYTQNGAVGSVSDYYKENSLGAFTPVFDVYGPVQLDTTMAYYGTNDYFGNDMRAEMALVHAVQKLDDQIDFTQYDNDRDGQVDFIMFYYAGFDEAQGANSKCIWSHAWMLSESSYARDQAVYDGVQIENYFCTAELYGTWGSTLCRIGTTCHEFAHTLGLPDFYDTDNSSGGWGANTYDLDLMSGGNYNADSSTPPYFSAEELWEVGWLSEIPVMDAAGPVTLGPVNHPGATGYTARKLLTSTQDEYFLFEVRGRERWDAPIPEGLLVYHVDRSTRRIRGSTTAISTWDANTVNNYSSHPCCYIVPASNPTSTAEYNGSLSNLFFPRPGQTSYLPTDWNDAVTAWFLDGITYADGQASWVMKDARGISATGYNYIADPFEGVHHAGESFPLTLVTATGDKAPAGPVQWSVDGESVSEGAVTLPAGHHEIEATFTTEGGTTKKVLLELDVQ